MLVKGFFGTGDMKLATLVAALLFALGIVLMAGPAGAAPCPSCDDGGGGGTNNSPTVNANNASRTAPEGQTAANAGTYSDPDGNGTVTLSASVGSVTKDASGDGTWSWSFNTNDGPDQSQTVTITATDSAGATATTNFSLTVNNLSPVIYWQSFNSLQPPEGVARRYEFGVYDPGNDTFTVHGRECGNGVKDSQDSGTTALHYVECRFPDGPGSTVVTATATDSDEASSSTGNLAVEITNVNPTAILNAPVSVDEGDTATISLTNQNDVQADKNAGFRYAFACDGAPLDGATHAASGTSASTNCALEGSKTQTVRARIIDKDGGYSEYTREVAINNIAPNGTIKINAGAIATKSATVSLALSATDPLPGSGVGSMRFRNENTETWSAWEPYATSREWLLSNGDGAKTVHVQYLDNAGNVSTAAIQDGIQLDTTTPDMTITSGPSGTVKSNSASFGFSSSEAGSTFECKLDDGAFTSCTSPKSYTNLKNGSHTFSVRAMDAAGNVDATPAARTWTVDAIKPTISGMFPKHGSVTKDRTPAISATVRDNRTNLQKSNIKLYVAGKRIASSKFSYSASRDLLVYNSSRLSKGKKVVKIVATDAAGNVGARSWYFTIR